MTAPPDATHPETTVEAERRTSYLELFFDLVFVFAITQVTQLILDDPTASGIARAALALGLVWWAWSAYAWLTNAIEIERPAVRLSMLTAMAGAFFMALAVPQAFGEEGAWFAICYAVVRGLMLLLYLTGTRDRPEQAGAMLRLAPWFVAGPALVLAGGFLDDPLRTWLWLASLAVDVAGTLMSESDGWNIQPSHFAERYGLFVIIALGESVVAVGIGAAELARDATFALSVAIAFAGIAALWWAYFDFTALAAERALRRRDGAARARFARDVFTFLHYPIVLGVIFYAVAAKKTLAKPDEPLSSAGRWTLGLGVASFLAAFVLARLRAGRLVAWERLVAAAASLLAVVVLRDADALVLLAVVVGIVVAMTTLESFRLREARAAVRPA